MARRRRRNNYRRRRVTPDNTNRRLPISVHSVPYSSDLRRYEDRRTWHPDGNNRSAKSFNNQNHRLRVVDKQYKRRRIDPQTNKHYKIGSQTKATVAFDAPEKVLVCVRRKIRQEVLHAIGKTGKKGQRKPKFNQYSNISCRRK